MTLPFSNDTTSKAAAQNPAVVARAKSQRQRILDYLTHCGVWGSTAEQIGKACNLKMNSLHPRVWQLELDELIVKTDEKRPLDSGLYGHVYKLAQYA